MKIFRPEFPCIDGNLAAKFVNESYQLTAVTVEDLGNFYLIPYYL
jgi:hypothetical protein